MPPCPDKSTTHLILNGLGRSSESFNVILPSNVLMFLIKNNMLDLFSSGFYFLSGGLNTKSIFLPHSQSDVTSIYS
jgi:hypothetical protein